MPDFYGGGDGGDFAYSGGGGGDFWQQQDQANQQQEQQFANQPPQQGGNFWGQPAEEVRGGQMGGGDFNWGQPIPMQSQWAGTPYEASNGGFTGQGDGRFANNNRAYVMGGGEDAAPPQRVGSPWGGGGYDPMQFSPGNYAGGGYGSPQQQNKWRDWAGANGGMDMEMTQEKWDAMPPEMQQQWREAGQMGGGFQPQQGGNIQQPHVMPQAGIWNPQAPKMDAQGNYSTPPPPQLQPMPPPPPGNVGAPINAAASNAAGSLMGGIGGAMKGMFGFGGGNKSPQPGGPAGSFISNIMQKNKAIGAAGSASSQGGPFASMIGGAASMGPAVTKKPMMKAQGLQPGPSAQPPMGQA